MIIRFKFPLTWVSFLWLFVFSDYLYAICPKPTPKTCSAYYVSDAVFYGTVISEKEDFDKDDNTNINGWIYKIKVKKVYKGNISVVTNVYTENDTARFRLTVNKDYLLFASNYNGALEISDTCGYLSEPKNIPLVTQEIKKILATKNSVIEGEVLTGNVDGSAAKDVDIKIIGNDGEYHVKSNAKGQFYITLKPGQYKVELDKPKIRLSDYSNIDLNKIDLVAGQCAQIQLLKDNK